MSACLVPVVEGHGEVEAVPHLIRRYIAAKNPPFALTVGRAIRVHRGSIVKDGEIERAVTLARYSGDAVLVLLDADDDCPAQLGPQLQQRAQNILPASSVVLAKSEFESWFVCAAASLRGKRALRDDLTAPDDPESIRDAKGWLSRNMVNPRLPYSETIDQPALSMLFDIDLARKSDSFDKLLRELDRLFDLLAAAGG
jgi:hypothetical protein